MNLELVKTTIDPKPILANLLELYAYDFTEHCDIDNDGFMDISIYHCIGKMAINCLI